MNTPRTPKGVPAGGEFATIARADADIVLSDPSAVHGWGLKKYRILGTGAAGVTWSAIITHFGRPRLTVSDPGTGEPVTLTGQDETAERDFTRTAHTVIGPDTAAAAELLRLLQLSHRIDDEARVVGASRQSLLDVHLALGEISDSDYTHLTS